MQELYEVVCQMFGTYDYAHCRLLEPKPKMEFIRDAANHILGLEDGKARFKQ
jgi:hypothetical protein